MWPVGSRETAWERLRRPWDVIVIGGGIVGAGIAREAAQQGLSVLLLDQGDFSSGTSSRSSKFVHGGLRYLKNGAFRLTYQAVTERQRLLREGAGLVNPTRFLLTHYTGGRPGLATMRAVLGVYNAMGRQWTHQLHSPLRGGPWVGEPYTSGSASGKRGSRRAVSGFRPPAVPPDRRTPGRRTPSRRTPSRRTPSRRTPSRETGNLKTNRPASRRPARSGRTPSHPRPPARRARRVRARPGSGSRGLGSGPRRSRRPPRSGRPSASTRAGIAGFPTGR